MCCKGILKIIYSRLRTAISFFGKTEDKSPAKELAKLAENGKREMEKVLPGSTNTTGAKSIKAEPKEASKPRGKVDKARSTNTPIIVTSTGKFEMVDLSDILN